ncbi:general secretion pathway protein GspB [Desulfurivibrio alkaliphilus]|uniref:Type II secretion system protein GspB C-terminal domain-containing protein n=1 Tax=Desulfurivibrio alkaliphilus (strain DSM 19089 / UNIQEM U267 / AHT2) TaxID=589865 RepID=D6Z763_DESAT|nr:general secretion pathway protein GspB [Desulfurivibrio alkaliphilus]ADH87050.1 conserved hypothetical protein [Desulfurivibrio alkaliphilus AHT 2]
MKTTREKIIVGLMGLAVLYFVYDFFLVAEPEPPAPTARHDAALIMAVELQRDLAAGKFEPPESALQAVAELQQTLWSADLFVSSDFLLLDELPKEPREHVVLEELRAAAERLVYSGYLKMGDRRLAVINGKEYQRGDTVVGDIRLQRIEPQYLELGLGGHAVRLAIIDPN